jgi:hypothetical protein
MVRRKMINIDLGIEYIRWCGGLIRGVRRGVIRDKKIRDKKR